MSPDVVAIVTELERFLNSKDDQDATPCNATCGVYAFFDYDGEPIYVGQTREQLRSRIRRHLTNQRTDAVAMDVLDPMEVARIEVWPFWDLQKADKKTQQQMLASAEYTLYLKVLEDSPIGRVLNEKIPAPAPLIDLPPSFSGSIVPDHLRERLGHSDIRIARRAAEIASLARIITEREVQLGLRNALVTQAKRLERLASDRYSEVCSETPDDQVRLETVGSENEEGDGGEG